MYVKDVTIQKDFELRARYATFFVQTANRFKSAIWIEKDERRVVAKSLLGVIALGVLAEDNMRIIADGIDEVSAVDSLVKLVESGFDTKVMEDIV